ncbi:MAG TPA: preprotein translocase YidC, partial [Sutterella sp.]|nr:preprotein translocase YidC [Sutterella sp.]
MLDFIYTLFIAPLEYWMHKVLVWGYGITENWGLAIIVMSLVVNFVILPIYIKAESWQEEEQRVRLGFASREEMIRRAFKGQERFAMISTMRRQAGYTAFLSMR